MEQYDKNVMILIALLKDAGYSHSVISAHNICYREFRDYLTHNNRLYSTDSVCSWLEQGRLRWIRRVYTTRRFCMKQLEDVYSKGHISPEHLGVRVSPYSILNNKLRDELDDFLKNSSEVTDDRYRVSCARFLLYIQNQGLTSITEVDHSLLIRFHNEDYHSSYKSKDIYEDMIRAFLRYHASIGNCSDSLSLLLNKLLIFKVITIPHEELETLSQDGIIEINLSLIESFTKQLETLGYKNTVIKSSRHILTLLYIFHEMHSIPISKEVLWYWFDTVKPYLKLMWIQHRRSLCQYVSFVEKGIITTSLTGNPLKKDSIYLLPEWSRVWLEKFLTLLKREGWKDSTIQMYKHSNLRFCLFLKDIGIQDFQEITPEILRSFNVQDHHTTAESKVAYNSRIRRFLIYLFEQHQITNAFLYRALPKVSAAKTRVVSVLSDEEVKNIWSIDISTLSPIAFRDYAIVCVGLCTGLRASDISAIRFQDINWKNRTINIVQQKTGKALLLPFPVKMGNVLFRYLRDARPESASPYIFIKHEPPFGKLNPGVCRRALMRVVPERKDNKKGFHIVRKTFATGLLKGNARLEIIADSLGHSTDHTVYKYLSLDEERMCLCPISLSDIGISWKGGPF